MLASLYRNIKLSILCGVILTGAACSKVDFSPTVKAVRARAIEPGPVTSPVVTPSPSPTPTPSPVLMVEGECTAKKELTACLSCPDVPKPKDPSKADQLAKIMYLSCQVPNKSDPQGYVAPDFKTINNRLDMCLEAIYPISSSEIGSPSGNQKDLIQKLMAEDPAARQKLFGKLWFTPPASDYFETYFGLSVAEARYQFCYAPSALTGILATTAYAKAAIEGDPIAWYNSNPQGPEQTTFRIANVIRDQLKSCLDAPGQPPAPVNPNPKKCSYKSYPAITAQDAMKEAGIMLGLGYTLSAEGPYSCREVKDPYYLSGYEGEFKLVGMLCTP